MNIVVLDSDKLAGDADFPEVDCPKFGWLQYVETVPEQVEDRCWRSDIIISVSTEVNSAVIEKAFKLKLIAVAGDSCDHIDFDATRERGIKVCNVPGSNPASASETGEICEQVIENINAFLKGNERNLVES